MSDFTFSLEQILDSVNELRMEVRECIDPTSSTVDEVTPQTWQPSSDEWFDDCEFDPR